MLSSRRKNCVLHKSWSLSPSFITWPLHTPKIANVLVSVYKALSTQKKNAQTFARQLRYFSLRLLVLTQDSCLVRNKGEVNISRFVNKTDLNSRVTSDEEDFFAAKNRS